MMAQFTFSNDQTQTQFCELAVGPWRQWPTVMQAIIPSLMANTSAGGGQVAAANNSAYFVAQGTGHVASTSALLYSVSAKAPVVRTGAGGDGGEGGVIRLIDWLREMLALEAKGGGGTDSFPLVVDCCTQ